MVHRALLKCLILKQQREIYLRLLPDAFRVVTIQRSGEPGKSGSEIWIRGISTFTSSSPLVLVDGVERTFNQLDPEDIESFTILKDASATAVYGVRGANGVILIKTKPGRVGKPQFSVDYYEGSNDVDQTGKIS